VKLLVTGGAGFIGSNFIRHVLNTYPDDEIVNLDKLTYAGNLDNLREVAENPATAGRYRFVRGDICDAGTVDEALVGCDAIVNFAAETHVDRSIVGAKEFLLTDVVGTYVLLEATRTHQVSRYVQVSTDEVYGSVSTGSATEEWPLAPSSPYSASKAGGDMQVLASFVTYGTPAMITRGSNTYGPYQYPEKVIPLFVTNALEGKKLPLYGEGINVRDWLHVLDHCAGIDTALRRGTPGEIYNVGGGNERQNREVAAAILRHLALGDEMIERVADRPGHDMRYSIDSGKLKALGWNPARDFEQGLAETIDWYRENESWWKKIKHHTDEFADWEKRWYEERR
jgi:dTDP-glucose 4,6-dehydratase